MEVPVNGKETRYTKLQKSQYDCKLNFDNNNKFLMKLYPKNHIIQKTEIGPTSKYHKVCTTIHIYALYLSMTHIYNVT